MSEINIKVVGIDKLHESITEYVQTKEINIVEYDDMKQCILNMIRDGYLFNLDRDRLRDAMEDLTYMYSPNDDLNKDRVGKGLEYEYSEDEDEISDDEGDNSDSGLNLINLMMKDPSFSQLMNNIGNMNEELQREEDDSPRCPVAPPLKESENPEEKDEPIKEEEEINDENKDKCDDCPSKDCDDCPDKRSSTPEKVKVEVKEEKEEVKRE